MALRIRYNRVTTPAGTEPDQITTARLGVAFQSNAEEGSTAITAMVVDDESNALDYVGLRRVYAYETAAPAHNQIVYNGYLQARTIGRGPAQGMDSDESITGRRWTLQIADTNSLLSRRIITGADGERKAETDVARIQWLLTANDRYLSNPQDTWDTAGTYVNTVGALDMEAADLRGQTAFDVLNDCAQRSGKNWGAFYLETNDTVPPTNGGSITLWYDFDYSTAYTSSVRLTNVRADVDNVTTFFVNPDATLGRDPSRNYSGILLNYSGGSVYTQSTNVANLFQRRDTSVSNANVKSAAAAATLSARYLEDAAREEDRLTCRFVVAKQYVNSLREWQRCQVNLSWLPGYTGYNYARVLSRTVRQLTDDFYEIGVELSPNVAVGLVQQASSGPGGVATTVTQANPVVAGNLLVLVQARRDHTGWTDPTVDNSAGPGRAFAVITGTGLISDNDVVRIGWRIATGDEKVLYFGTSNLSCTVYEITGAAAAATWATLMLSDQAASTTKTLGTFSASAGSLNIAGYIWGDSDGVIDDGQTVGPGWTKDYNPDTGDYFGGGYHPARLTMSTSGANTVMISGQSYVWAAVAIQIPRA